MQGARNWAKIRKGPFWLKVHGLNVFYVLIDF